MLTSRGAGEKQAKEMSDVYATLSSCQFPICISVARLNRLICSPSVLKVRCSTGEYNAISRDVNRDFICSPPGEILSFKRGRNQAFLVGVGWLSPVLLFLL